MVSPVRIRFLMHTMYASGGGVLTVVRNLAVELAQRHEVELVTITRARDRPVHAFPAGPSMRTLADVRPSTKGRLEPVRRWAIGKPSRLIPETEPFFRSYSLYSDVQLVRYLRGARDGVLVGMQPGANMMVARFGRSSVVRIGQDHRPFVVRERMLPHLQRQLPKLDMLLTLTTTDAEEYRRALGDRPPIRVMENATPEYEGPLSTLDSKVVVAAAHLSRDKGLDRLIDAWVGVHARHPDWELRIFGEGPLRRQLSEQIEGLGLQGVARMMGYSRSMMSEMVAASVFVLSSRVEGYGMVLVEAMSAGVPVVSFDAPTGPRDIISDGEDGFLVPNGDVEGLADAICRLIEDEPLRGRLAASGRVTAQARTQPAIARRWETLFDELGAR